LLLHPPGVPPALVPQEVHAILFFLKVEFSQS